MELSPVLFIYVAAFLTGLYCGPVSPGYAVPALAAAGAVAVAVSGRTGAARGLLACALFLLGSERATCGAGGSAGALPEGRDAILRGRVGVVTEHGLFLETASGRIWVRGERAAGSCMEGDSMLVMGYADSGSISGMAFEIRPSADPLTQARRRLASLWADRCGPGQGASLVSALLVGERSGMPDRMRRVFRDSGTSHILSVSGFHVGMVAAAVFFALRKVAGGRRWAGFAAVLLVAGYVLLTGARPPAVRSGFMSAAVIIGAGAGVRLKPLVVWSLAAILVLGISDSVARDAGAQMSFAAVLALVLLSVRFGGRLGGLLTSLYSGVCVTLSLVPLIASTYGVFQLSSPYATLMSVPFMVCMMVVGALALLPAGSLPGSLAGPVAAAWLGALDAITLEPVGFGGAAEAVAWFCCLAALLYVSRRRGFLRRFR